MRIWFSFVVLILSKTAHSLRNESVDFFSPNQPMTLEMFVKLRSEQISLTAQKINPTNLYYVRKVTANSDFQSSLKIIPNILVGVFSMCRTWSFQNTDGNTLKSCDSSLLISVHKKMRILFSFVVLILLKHRIYFWTNLATFSVQPVNDAGNVCEPQFRTKSSDFQELCTSLNAQKINPMILNSIAKVKKWQTCSTNIQTSRLCQTRTRHSFQFSTQSQYIAGPLSYSIWRNKKELLCNLNKTSSE